MNDAANKTTLIYAYDPMCSWCWGFAPVWKSLVEKLAVDCPDITIRKILGGLAPDSEEPMAAEMCQYLQQTWKTIMEKVPGTEFNFDFWTENTPMRSTWPSCRAVIAARAQGVEYEEQMSRAIQVGYYLNARNPAERSVLKAFAAEIGLDSDRFARDLDSDEIRAAHQNEMAEVGSYGIQGFPSLALIGEKTGYRIGVNYTDADAMLTEIKQAFSEMNN